MEEPISHETEAVVSSASPPRQTPGPAFASAIIPGLGQFALGEKRRGTIHFALLALWVLLFFPPVQSPRNWWVWGNQELFVIALAIVSTWQALRSKAGGKRRGHFALLIPLIPLAAITMAAAHHFLTRAAGFRDFKVPSSAMEPTIPQGCDVMADPTAYRHRSPADGEIVLVKSPIAPGVIHVKRVIAEGGDTISSGHGDISRNGSSLVERYVQHIGGAPDELMSFGPLQIPPHKLFVMGDNRDVSLDSRTPTFGLLDDSAAVGRVLYRFNCPHDEGGKRLQ
jgi:signal peptidase I